MNIPNPICNPSRSIPTKISSIAFRRPPEDHEKLQVGSYCACPSESEDWYRGLIRQIDGNGHAMVFKIDYGDVQCIPIQFLRPLKVHYSHLFLSLSHRSRDSRNDFFNWIVWHSIARW